jgi:hypothetical protein
MKSIRCSLSLLILAIGLLLGGCANMSAQKAPGTDFTKIKSIYVVHLPADGRGINRVIADQLGVMG